MIQIADLFENGRHRQLPKGQVVIYEGDPTSNLYYIVSGYVKVYNISNTGTVRIIFIYGPSDVFPLTSYLSGSGVARYFYECMTEVELRILSNEEMRDKLVNNIEVGEALIGYSNTVNQQFLQRIDVLSVNDARRKVIALLAFLVEKVGTPGDLSRIEVPLTQQDIANLCGLTRETASAQILRLKKQGIISGSKKLIVNKKKINKLKPKVDLSA